MRVTALALAGPVGLACLAALAMPAMAHFQEIIPSADVLPEGGEVTLELVFTHPVEETPVMEMKKPVQAGVLTGGKVTDLLPTLIENPVDAEAAWTLTYDAVEPGASIFFVEPTPITHGATAYAFSVSGDGPWLPAAKTTLMPAS